MTPTKFDRKSELLDKLKQFKDYGGMRYRIEVGEYTGKDWLKISLGCSEKGKEVFITTDRIHCSEDTGTAESDAELITILLNAFCDGTIPNVLLDNSLSERPMMSESKVEEELIKWYDLNKDFLMTSHLWAKSLAHALSGNIPAPEKVLDRNCCTTTGEHWWLKEEPNVCSICGFNKKDKVITYEDWKGVIRDTPLTIKGLKQVGRTLFFVDLDDESIGVLATSIIDYLNKRERSNE